MKARRVLLVDDDELIRELVATTLGTGEFGILMAEDGPSALDVARDERPDLIFLDVAMPGIDGVEVCRLLRQDERTRNTVIVMLTARSSDADRQRALAAGANAYVVKPFSPLALRRLVEQLDTGH